jgi:hypothetical protein
MLSSLVAVVENELLTEKQKEEPSQPPISRHTSKKWTEKYAQVVHESLGIVHSIKILFYSQMSVISFRADEKYLVGVQIAQLLHRKTFNLYRCMKKKKIALRRALPEEVEFLTNVGAVHSGTHSVTLVPYQEGLCFIADAYYRYVRFPNEGPTMAKRRKSYAQAKCRIHRRKPLPWDVQRAIKVQSGEVTNEQLSPKTFCSTKASILSSEEITEKNRIEKTSDDHSSSSSSLIQMHRNQAEASNSFSSHAEIKRTNDLGTSRQQQYYDPGTFPTSVASSPFLHQSIRNQIPIRSNTRMNVSFGCSLNNDKAPLTHPYYYNLIYPRQIHQMIPSIQIK